MTIQYYGTCLCDELPKTFVKTRGLIQVRFDKKPLVLPGGHECFQSGYVEVSEVTKEQLESVLKTFGKSQEEIDKLLPEILEELDNLKVPIVAD